MLGRRTAATKQVEDHARIDAEVPADQADHDDGTNANTATPARHPARRTGLAIIFDIAAGAKIVCAYLSFPNRVPLELQAAHYPSRRTAMKDFSGHETAHARCAGRNVLHAEISVGRTLSDGTMVSRMSGTLAAGLGPPGYQRPHRRRPQPPAPTKRSSRRSTTAPMNAFKISATIPVPK